MNIEKANELLNKMDTIDIEKEIYSIMDNPNVFFKPYLEEIKDPLFILFAYFRILTIIRKMDTAEELCHKTTNYFMKKYSTDQWLDKLINFYNYYLSVIQYLMDNHNNIILDAYNEKRLGKASFEKAMKSFEETKENLLKDQEEINECIRGIEQEKENIKEFLD